MPSYACIHQLFESYILFPFMPEQWLFHHHHKRNFTLSQCWNNDIYHCGDVFKSRTL